MKIAINICYGGFSLSRAAYEHMGLAWDGYGYLENEHFPDIPESAPETAYRAHPKLIAAIEELGIDANGQLSSLRIVEIPDNIHWHIRDYDGAESIHEDHRVWF